MRCIRSGGPFGSIPLNIYEMWPLATPYTERCYRREKTPVDHFIGNIPLLYKKVIKHQI